MSASLREHFNGPETENESMAGVSGCKLSGVSSKTMRHWKDICLLTDRSRGLLPAASYIIKDDFKTISYDKFPISNGRLGRGRAKIKTRIIGPFACWVQRPSQMDGSVCQKVMYVASSPKFQLANPALSPFIFNNLGSVRVGWLPSGNCVVSLAVGLEVGREESTQ